jgi:hypothetical protein
MASITGSRSRSDSDRQSLEATGRRVSTRAAAAIGGGSVFVLGALLPWFSSPSFYSTYEVKPGYRNATVLFGLVFVVIGLLRLRSDPLWLRIVQFVTAAGATLFAVCLIAAGLHGFQDSSVQSVTVKYDPGSGLILTLLGSLACALSTIGVPRPFASRAKASTTARS